MSRAIACERRDALEADEPLVVPRELARPDLGVVLDPVELDERDRGEDVGEVRLEAGRHLVVACSVAAAGEPHAADRLGDVVAVRRDEAALPRGDVLRRVEGEAGRVGEPAELAAPVAALEGMRGVLDDGDPERVDRIEVAGLPREVDGEDRLRPLGDERRQERRVEVQVVLAHVAEDGGRARVLDDVRGRGPGDRRRDHLVAGRRRRARAARGASRRCPS